MKHIINQLINNYIINYPEFLDEIINNIPEEDLKNLNFDRIEGDVAICNNDVKDLPLDFATLILEYYVDNEILKVYPRIMENILDYVSLTIDVENKKVHCGFTGVAESIEDKDILNSAFDIVINTCRNLGFDKLSFDKTIDNVDIDFDFDSEEDTLTEYTTGTIILK